jgi:hypothetical protein
VSCSLASQAPVTHRFTPERFCNTLSFAHPPALKVRPGDRVIAKTIDEIANVVDPHFTVVAKIRKSLLPR